MNSTIQAFGSVVARIMIATIFLMSAIGNKIPKFNDVAAYMASEHVPLPQLMLAGAIAFLIAGGLSIMVGFRARLGAGLLLVFLVLATYFFHDFWTFDDPAEKQQQLISFMKNLALGGTMLFIIVNGPGAASIDRRTASKE